MTNVGPREFQCFFVAMKALAVRDGKLLLVRESTRESWWELPGGRFDVGEEKLDPREVLRRELSEELGAKFRCTIGAPTLTWIRPVRYEIKEFSFVVAHLCTDVSGEIELSHEHVEYRWADERTTFELGLAPSYERPLREFWSSHAR
jgi:8-oxo-dGTP diphosphatase